MCSQQYTSSRKYNHSLDQAKCRICHEDDDELFSVCNCSGSVAYVHEECIVKWIKKKSPLNEQIQSDIIQTPKCQICKFPYKAKINIKKRIISRQLIQQNIMKNISLTNFFTFFVYMTIGLWLWTYYGNPTPASFEPLLKQLNMEYEDHLTYDQYGLVYVVYSVVYVFLGMISTINFTKQIIKDSKYGGGLEITLLSKKILKSQQQCSSDDTIDTLNID